MKTPSHKKPAVLHKHEVPLSPFEAFRLVVYGQDVPTLAREMGLKPGTLWNKADADDDSHAQPTLRDVIQVTRLTGDTTILESLDRMFDRAGFPLPPPNDGVSDAALLELLLGVGSEHGQLCQAVQRALTDARFSSDELQRIRGEAFDLVSQVMAFLSRVEGLVDD